MVNWQWAVEMQWHLKGDRMAFRCTKKIEFYRWQARKLGPPNAVISQRQVKRGLQAAVFECGYYSSIYFSNSWMLCQSLSHKVTKLQSHNANDHAKQFWDRLIFIFFNLLLTYLAFLLFMMNPVFTMLLQISGRFGSRTVAFSLCFWTEFPFFLPRIHNMQIFHNCNVFYVLHAYKFSKFPDNSNQHGIVLWIHCCIYNIT